MPQWRVKLYVYGPVVVRRKVTLREPKGSNPDDPFYSDISIRNSPSGFGIELTARADNEKLARRASLHFIGQALDVLAIDIGRPLYLSLLERQPNRAPSHDVRRVVERNELHHAFESARDLNQRFPAFLRALSWYRKGLYTEDPFDKFLAFWNSIENVTSNYHPQGTCQGKGSKCYMWEGFKQLWGECREWPVITGDTDWIDGNYDIRKVIAHGLMPVNIRRVETILEKLGNIETVAHRFLTDWRRHST